MLFNDSEKKKVAEASKALQQRKETFEHASLTLPAARAQKESLECR